MQFSLKYLLAVVTTIALACVALVYATPWWAGLAFTISIGALLAALVFIYAAKGNQRAYWIGFAIFGWGYWLVLMSPLLANDYLPNQWQISGDRPLVTQEILNWIYFHAFTNPRGTYPNGMDFARVGHSLFDLLAALLGGASGHFAYRRYRSGRP